MGDQIQIVQEWLNDWETLAPAELHSFAAEHEQSQDVVLAIYAILEERTKHAELLEPVCTQLFGFYRSREVSLQRFALQFLPTLIYIYLHAVVNSDKKNHKCIETLLIGLYNLEVMDENGKPKVVSFRLPSLAQASIYHEPLTLGPAFLTESSLRRWEECNTKLVNWGPLPQVEALNAQNRAKVMTALLFVFNRQLSLLPKSALRQLCIVASRLVTQGFSNLSTKPGCSTPQMDHRNVLPLPPRIPVTSQLLLELVHGAYFAMFNEFYTLALQAVNDIAARACYEGYPDVLLVTGAVTNSLQANPSGQPCDGPMGISVALSPATTTVTVSKSMITNASFRTKKLPDEPEGMLVSKKPGVVAGVEVDLLGEQTERMKKILEFKRIRSYSTSACTQANQNDIPIQIGANATEAADGLNSITEETESDINTNQRNTSFRNSKSKLPSFPGLGKKTKDKEKENKDKIILMKNSIASDNMKKSQPPKDIVKTHSKGSLIPATNGENGDFPSPLLQKKMNDMQLEGNSTILSEEKVSLVSDSLQNSAESSDSHSQMTTDSLDLDTATTRLASMQVSSV